MRKPCALCPGHDAAHVRDYGLEAAKDRVVLDRAAAEDRIIVSADSDFGALLAQHQRGKPSLLLLRWPGLRRASGQTRVILANLPNVADALEAGAIIVIEPSRVRVRSLPIGVP